MSFISCRSVALLGSQGLDPDTILWRDAVMANSGTVSTSSISAFDNFFKGLKADLLWPKIVDMGAFVGVGNLNAAMVKLKTAPSVSRILTNTNFVGGDYTPTGASAGLLGNGTSKKLGTNYAPSSANNTNLSYGFYLTNAMNNLVMGARNGSVLQAGDAAGEHFHFGSARVNLVAAPASGGLFSGSGSASNSKGFVNGSLNASLGSGATNGGSTTDWTIFTNRAGIAGESNSRPTFYFTATVFSDAEQLLFSNRVNALMTAFGANKY